MNLTMTADQKLLRDEIRAWLAEHAPQGPAPDLATQEGVGRARAWERELFDGGFAAVQWPKRFGGRGADPVATLIFYEEYLRSGAPPRLNRLGLGLAGPTLIDLGTPEQQDRWLSKILSCEHLWCQGFSEPGAGSDLAAIRTRGEVREDGILINGQKIWTSWSEHADWMFALVRTDPESRRHAGLTFLMIDMSDPGVDVRPIRQINHAREFGEVFLTDVLVPHENVIGRIDNGWHVAMSTLVHERGASLYTAAHFSSFLQDLIDAVPADSLEDAHVLAELGWLHEHIEAYRYMTLQTLSQVAIGKKPTAQASMGKLWWSELQVRLYELGLQLMGPAAELRDGEQGDPAPVRWRQRYWLSRAAMIYAGANEVQRNIISERVLGLPKDKRHAL
ncbi:acyl-CoA dehydrogenase family protein [Microbacterium sp. zg.B48]|uniref:acyl-CoA dehydrogenase family protein n=1 Tax=Microbacterium sp. zg.B48 TaxID=2969408 RepID=UPI00214BC110|nr:acyl-CoA dehydrogenase family protein [Microbacterium sp. zg.B48]MCR2764322.1 acyl-CoA dehydrogenase family protein [Microbacterium sp. zg.B48]